LFVIEVLEYLDQKGQSPYRDWLNLQDATARARIITSVLRMESGNLSGTKSVGAGVCELRLTFGPGYRIYFGRVGEQLVILLGGGIKNRQQTDIEAAWLLWAEYKIRKQEK
jgi:putative addiction module killer protein